MEIAEHVCSCTEIADLHGEPDENRRRQRFLDYWTLKEAYVKVRGKGLSIPLNQFSFSLPASGGIEITFDGTVQDHRDDWVFWLLCASRDHKSAVCAARYGGTTLALSVRSAVPLVGQQLMPFAIVRQSG
jgi:4'-phosphopantetheinyl transferase